MTTTETARTRHRGDRGHRGDDDDYGNAAERAAAGALAHRFAELGDAITMAEAHELAARIERQGIADLYMLAIDQSVAIKQNRQKCREMRRDA